MRVEICANCNQPILYCECRWKGTTFRERLLSKLIVNPETGRVEWSGRVRQASPGAGGGYAVTDVCGKSRYVHRVVYELFAGPIPQDAELDHLCRNRRCANVAHLEPVAKKVNILRGESPWAVNARKDVCVNGHEYTPENTYTSPDGWRSCRACKRARKAARLNGSRWPK